MFRKKAAGVAAKQASGKLSSKRKKVLAAAEAASRAKANALAAAASAGSRSAAADHASPHGADDADGLTQILDAFRASAEPLADLDERLALENQHRLLQRAAASRKSSVRPTPITYRSFAASLACEKKFYLMQERPDLVPRLSIGEAVHIDDAAGFNELARRWDRLQFGSKAILVADPDFEQAAQHTEEIINNYFSTTYASLGEEAPSLTIHRPAFAAPFGLRKAAGTEEVGEVGEEGGRGAALELQLQARPAVLRYRPKDNEWVVLESQAIVDPLGTAARAAQCLQRLHFSMLAFRYWVVQPHIPIAVRKRFLNINLDDITEENRKGHRLVDTAAVTAPIDLQRSGVLHIRQFFPGPNTLMDCPPPRLVKYIQRLSLEDLLEGDRRNAQRHSHHGNGSSAAFDLQNVGWLDPTVVAAQQHMHAAMEKVARHGSARSARGLKQRDHDEHAYFESQQRLMECLLRTHTMRLVEKAQDPQQRARWTSFAEKSPDGHVCSTCTANDGDDLGAAPPRAKGRGGGAAKRKGKAESAAPETPLIPAVPCFSEFLGAHCSRGDVCPFFAEGKCLPQRVASPVEEEDNHLFTLPSTAVSRKVVWWAEGLRTVRDVLHKYKQGTVKLTAPQLRYAKAVAEGEVAVNPKEIDKFFSRLRYPVFIIDFEAAQFALPPFQKVVPYQSVPFQFSMDVFRHDILTETPTHYDFLHFGKGHSPNADPRTPLIDELMRIVALERAEKRAAMEASGEMARLQQQQQQEEEEKAELEAAAGSGKRPGRKPKKKAAPKKAGGKKTAVDAGPQNPYDGCFVAHFASFEKSCLEKLGQLEERHKDTIKNFYFLDTMELIRKGFIHPNAGGSNSLKKVLPALCPDFQYGVFGGEGGNGGDGDSDDSADDAAGGDESSQKGENAMGVYRLWYHQEGGGTVQDLRRGSTLPGTIKATPPIATAAATAEPLPKDARERVWATLRIQLLEYCSLDTKALYEIMREIWKERELVRDLPPADKSGWVYTKPSMREVQF